MEPKDLAQFKQEQRDWILQRDQDSRSARTTAPAASTQDAEEAREASLISSTKRRLEKLEGMLSSGRH